MTRLGRWWRQRLERHLRRYYEGPEPPRRLVDHAFLFANECPKATRGDWIAFAIHLANEAYKSGWVRGYEASERGGVEHPARRTPTPEDIADEMDPGWRNGPNVLLGDAEEIVGRGAALDELATEET